MSDMERAFILFAVLGVALALGIAALVLMHIEARTQRRIWEDERDLSHLKKDIWYKEIDR